jgi:hypothetical protein
MTLCQVHYDEHVGDHEDEIQIQLSEEERMRRREERIEALVARFEEEGLPDPPPGDAWIPEGPAEDYTDEEIRETPVFRGVQASLVGIVAPMEQLFGISRQLIDEMWNTEMLFREATRRYLDRHSPDFDLPE